MNLTLLYHRVLDKKKRYSTPLSLMEENFRVLAKKTIVFPEEKKPFSFTLTFDDATFDFYHTVFPLLKKYQLKAVLAVPTFPILESSDLSTAQRLGLTPDFKKKSASFCTWKEIVEMSQCPLIEIASHSHSHTDLTTISAGLEKEIVLSKKVIEKHIEKSVHTFIYPFGKSSAQLEKEVKKHYRYSFRIGSSYNLFAPHYRIIADELPLKKVLSPSKKLFYFHKYFLNALKKK